MSEPTPSDSKPDLFGLLVRLEVAGWTTGSPDPAGAEAGPAGLAGNVGVHEEEGRATERQQGLIVDLPRDAQGRHRGRRLTRLRPARGAADILAILTDQRGVADDLSQIDLGQSLDDLADLGHRIRGEDGDVLDVRMLGPDRGQLRARFVKTDTPRAFGRENPAHQVGSEGRNL